MTIKVAATRNEFTATAGQTIFNYTFKIFVSTDLNVFQTPAGQVCNDITDQITAFTVSGVGSEDGGSITLNTGATVGDLITIVSDIASNRTTDYQFNGDFIPSTVNDDFDRVVSLVKQVEEIVNRTLVTQECLQGPKPLSLPQPVSLQIMRWKTDLSGLENIDSALGTPSNASIITYNQGGTGAVNRTVESRLQERRSVEDFGATGVGDETAIFQLAIDDLPAAGGTIVASSKASYTVTGSSLTIGNKVVNWETGTATISSELPSAEIKLGEFSLPTAAGGANRDVFVNNFDDAGETTADANDVTRQYIHHVTGFMTEDAAQTTERELRGYSFDLGTDVDNLEGDIRGIKGRVFATGGSANLRAMNAIAEAIAASGFTGDLTGFLATVFANGTSPNESVGVRSHCDDGVTSAFQAAGAGVTAIDEVSFGYQCRSGTGQPLLATQAYFLSHGGNGTQGQGDMYRGVTSTTDSTPIYRVNFRAQSKATSYFSGSVSINDDDVALIAPPAGTSGMFKVWVVTTSGTFAEVYYRVSGTALTQEGYKGTDTELTTGVLTGTTGTDAKLTISAANDGNIYVENRLGGTKTIGFTFFTDF